MEAIIEQTSLRAHDMCFVWRKSLSDAYQPDISKEQYICLCIGGQPGGEAPNLGCDDGPVSQGEVINVKASSMAELW